MTVTPPFDAADLHAPFDRFESVEGFLDFFLRDAPRVRRDDHGKAVAHVEFADQIAFQIRPNDLPSLKTVNRVLSPVKSM